MGRVCTMASMWSPEYKVPELVLLPPCGVASGHQTRHLALLPIKLSYQPRHVILNSVCSF